MRARPSFLLVGSALPALALLFLAAGRAATAETESSPEPVLAKAPPAARKVAVPTRNPWIAAGPYPMSHHNPAQTDVSTEHGPTKGKELEVGDVKTVPVTWCSSPLVKKVGDETTVIAGTATGLVKIRATGEAFEQVSVLDYPGDSDHSDITAEKIERVMAGIDYNRRNRQDWRLMFRSLRMIFQLDLTGMANGPYGVIDKDGYYYTAYNRTHLLKAFDDNRIDAPLRAVKHVDVLDLLSNEARREADALHLFGISMTYDGHLVAAASGGVFVFDRELALVDHVFFPGEHLENGIAVDEKRIYVTTSKHMYGLAWDGKTMSAEAERGGWQSAYDVMPEGEAMKLGAASHGSGTTPTLMGFGDDEDHLVVISDGHPEGAQIVAFWRDEIPEGFEQKPGTRSRRIAGQLRIPDARTTIEASPVAYGYGVLMIDSTYPEPAPVPYPLNVFTNALTAGITREAPRGMHKFDWLPDEDRFVLDWTLEHIDNTDWMPPGVSPQTGLAYLAHKEDGRYEYQAVEWDTGKLVARWRFPDDSVRWNTWGGMTSLLEDGDLLLGGFFTAKRFDIGHLR